MQPVNDEAEARRLCQSAMRSVARIVIRRLGRRDGGLRLRLNPPYELFGAASYRAKLVIAIPISPYVSFGSISTELDRPRHVRFTPNRDRVADVAGRQLPSFNRCAQQVLTL